MICMLALFILRIGGHMTEKELRKLSRVELLEMLVEMSKQNERLQANLKNQAEQHQTQIDQIKNDYQNRIKDLQSKLYEKKLVIGKAGSIAEACLQINKVFEAAQASAEQYLFNIRNQGERCLEMERETEEKVSKRIADAENEMQK